MQLTPSDEQRMMTDMLSRFLSDRAGAEGAGPMPDDDWKELGELGILGFGVPEDAGGFGAPLADLAAVATLLGRHIAITPYAGRGVALSAALLAEDNRNSQLLERVIAGEEQIGFGRYGGAKPVAVTRGDGGFIMKGICEALPWPQNADHVIVEASLEGAPTAFLVARDASGIAANARNLADHSQAATVVFDNVRLPETARLDVEANQLEQLVARDRVLLVAELVGLMQRCFDETVAYANERRQFGKAIGTFQVVRHRVARMFVALEQARSLLLRAALPCDEVISSADAPMAALAFVSRESLSLAQDAVQLHGGMGVTDDLSVARAHRRILCLSRREGIPEHARQKISVLAN